jgi:SAM-dependent methyltransferase
MTNVPPVTDPTNEQQREYWNGSDSREWVDDADTYDATLAPFKDLLLAAATPAPGERVLDIGCGNGATTLAAAGLVGDGTALGVDLSAPMLEVARSRAAAGGHRNARFVVADAQIDPLEGPHDVAVSRFGIMFFEDPVAAFRNIRGALKPGGRVAFVCWRAMLENEWLAVPNGALLQHLPPPEPPGPSAPGPFRFCDEGSLSSVLGTAGFTDASAEAVDAPMLVGGPGSIDDALAFVLRSGMARGLLANASDDQRRRATDAARDALVPYQTDRGVELNGAVWVVRAQA